MRRIELNCDSGILTAPGGSVALSEAEFRLLKLLLSQPGTEFSDYTLLDQIRAKEDLPVGAVWLLIFSLRGKLKRAGAKACILTTSKGYVLQHKGGTAQPNAPPSVFPYA